MEVVSEQDFFRELANIEAADPRLAAILLYFHARMVLMEDKADFIAKSVAVIKWLQPFLIAGLGIFIGSKL